MFEETFSEPRPAELIKIEVSISNSLPSLHFIKKTLPFLFALKKLVLNEKGKIVVKNAIVFLVFNLISYPIWRYVIFK